MKIGTSLSRCVRDIYEGKVDIYDVMIIIARTDVDPYNDNHWNSLWKGYAGGNGKGGLYSAPEWNSIPAEDEDQIRGIIQQLHDSGKLHQPRQYGAHPQRMNDYWYDAVLTPENLKDNPVAKDAWDTYKVAAKLSSVR
jgi:hypothetical protein